MTEEYNKGYEKGRRDGWFKGFDAGYRAGEESYVAKRDNMRKTLDRMTDMITASARDLAEGLAMFMFGDEDCGGDKNEDR